MVKHNRVDEITIGKLLLRLKNNDIDSFHELYLLLTPPIYAYSLSILKHREDALDNIQDVFITIYEKIDNYEEKDKALSWIFTITKNMAMSKLRKKKITVDIDNEIISTTDKKEETILLKNLMTNLTEEERNIILLHLLWGFKYKEIAKILNSNLSTVLSKYHRSIKKLKKMESVI